MNAAGETQVAEAVKRPRKRNLKADGQDRTPASPVVAPAQVVSRPGSQNSAAREAPTDPKDWVDRNHPARAVGIEILDAEGGVVRGSGRRKIAICGFASSSRDMIPVNDPAWEVWGLNQLYRHIARADRWFDVHYYWDQEIVEGTDGGFDKAGSYKHWLAHSGVPVYMHHLVPEIPTSVRYPLEKIIAAFEADYFTSTIAFMAALAIWEIDQAVAAEVDARLASMRVSDFVAARGRGLGSAVERMRREIYGTYTIGVFGVDLIVGDEYFWQKACAEYWLGAASARGIMVALPPTTALCKQMYRYGYEKEPDTPIRLSDVDEHIAALGKEREETLRKMYCLDGALQADEYWRQYLTLRLRGMAQNVGQTLKK